MINRAATQGLSASQDYAELKQEAVRLARRILAQLDDGGMEPVDLYWGHVGDMASYRNQLRQLSDQMFGEDEAAVRDLRGED